MATRFYLVWSNVLPSYTQGLDVEEVCNCCELAWNILCIGADKQRTMMYSLSWRHQGHISSSCQALVRISGKITEKTIHLAHSVVYKHRFIWSSYPSPKTAKIDYSALINFDPPSAFLFSLSLLGAVALMKMFTYFGSKLGLDTVSEEPVNIPTR